MAPSPPPPPCLATVTDRNLYAGGPVRALCATPPPPPNGCTTAVRVMEDRGDMVVTAQDVASLCPTHGADTSKGEVSRRGTLPLLCPAPPPPFSSPGPVTWPMNNKTSIGNHRRRKFLVGLY